MKNTPHIVLILLFAVNICEGAAGLSLDFNDPGDAQRLRKRGVNAEHQHEGVVHFLGQNEVALSLPANPAVDVGACPWLRVRFCARSPRRARVLWKARGEMPKGLDRAIVTPFDKNHHTWWVRLADSDLWRGEIERVDLVFEGRPGWLELDSIEVRPFSIKIYLQDQWREFWLPRSFYLGTINRLSSPRLPGGTWGSLLNILALALIVLTAAACWEADCGRRRAVVSRVALGLLGLWLIADLREVREQAHFVATIYQSYVKPAPEQKTFPSLDDFYRFVALCEQTIPPDEQYRYHTEPDWPTDCRITYFLYPRRITSDTWVETLNGKDVPFQVVYKDFSVRYDPDTRCIHKATGNGSIVISKPGSVMARYGPHSFIFREDSH